MPNDIVQVVGDRIAVDLDRVNAMSESVLIEQISAWLEGETGDGLFSGLPIERFREWLDSVVLPHCRKTGEAGQRAWDEIRDPNSVFAKDRVASIFLTLSVLSGIQQLDVSTAVAIIVLAIRNKSGAA